MFWGPADVRIVFGKKNWKTDTLGGWGQGGD